MMNRNLSTVMVLLATLFVMPFGAARAQAGSYPDRPITVIVSYPVGGSVDATARTLQRPLATLLGQPIVVENRGGAGGTLGTSAVAKAKPDGYTVLMTLSSHTINPSLYPALNFDTEKDLTPVSLVASTPQVLVAHPAVQASTLAELVALSKTDSARPITYGSAGIGSPSHIAGELFRLKTGANVLHVPYRGGGPATIAVLGGEIQLLWVSLPSIMQHIRSGKVKALAVTTEARTSLLPEVATVADLVPGFKVDGWNAMFAPAGTPSAIVEKLQQTVHAVVHQPEVQKALLEQGAIGVGSTPAQLDEVVKTEIPLWRTVIREADIRLQ